MLTFPQTVPATINPVWLVGFCDPEPDTLETQWRDRCLGWGLRHFLRPGFRHCFALRPMHRGDGWMFFNPHSACVDVLELPDDALVKHLLADAKAGHGALVWARARRPVAWVTRGPMTCVAMVSHLLGVPSRPWTTPYALFRYLQKEGAKMGSVFSPPKPDTSVAEATTRKAEEEAAKLKTKNEAKVRAMRAGSGGRSLLTFAGTGERGVKTTLGAG